MKIHWSVKSGELAWHFCPHQHIPTMHLSFAPLSDVSQLLLHSLHLHAVVKIAKSARSLLFRFTPSVRVISDYWTQFTSPVHVPNTPRDKDRGSEADTCSTLMLCQRFSGLCIWVFGSSWKKKEEKESRHINVPHNSPKREKLLVPFTSKKSQT